MKKLLHTHLLTIVIGACLASCSPKVVKPLLLDSNTFLLTEVSNDPTYGYSEENPIHVGGAFEDGVKNQRRYLNALQGPQGQRISYSRLGSCCHFETPNGILGGGLLDKYEVKYDGLDDPVVLYINLYDNDSKPLKAPKGFTIVKK